MLRRKARVFDLYFRLVGVRFIPCEKKKVPLNMASKIPISILVKISILPVGLFYYKSDDIISALNLVSFTFTFANLARSLWDRIHLSFDELILAGIIKSTCQHSQFHC